jgi:hypothetical protein
MIGMYHNVSPSETISLPWIVLSYLFVFAVHGSRYVHYIYTCLYIYIYINIIIYVYILNQLTKSAEYF